MKKEHNEGNVFDGFTREQIEAMYEKCNSNLETPITGRIYEPTCYGCKNLVTPVNVWKDHTCKVFGKLPEKYWSDDRYECPYKVPENS